MRLSSGGLGRKLEGKTKTLGDGEGFGRFREVVVWGTGEVEGLKSTSQHPLRAKSGENTAK